MRKYHENILDSSVWVTVTPTAGAMNLPFHVMEMGHFFAEHNYMVQRDSHESFLLLYTIKGCGVIESGDDRICLEERQTLLLDCHKPHKYYSNACDWEFLWMHIGGVSLGTLYEMIYPSGLRVLQYSWDYVYQDLLSYCENGDMRGHMKISSTLHTLLESLYTVSYENANSSMEQMHMEDVQRVVALIHAHYNEPLTVDDMIANIAISKYHFIRVFQRIMGATPYNYLINYRIHVSKRYLSTTNLPVSEIAEKCGFADTSNFITHFKKHTGQKPLQYRNSFYGF